MKKRLLLFILLFLSSLTTVAAQTVQRTDKMPGFFIPSNALKTKQTRERLPAIEQMRYRGQQAPIIEQMRLEEQQKLAEKQREEEKLKQQKELEDFIKKSQEKTLAEQPETKPVVSNNKKETEKKPAAVSTQDIIRNRISKSRNKSNPQKYKTSDDNKIAGNAAAKEQEDKFNQIIREYRNDITNISKNKPFHNQRLIDMISDYKDIDRKI